jgi:hypothetical protein
MKSPCKHGSVLPWGLRCDRNYLSIRLKGPTLFKGCGYHTPENEKLAVLLLYKLRTVRRMDKTADMIRM